MCTNPVRHSRMIACVLCALLGVAAAPGVAIAQTPADKESLDHYKKGRTHYDLGRFDDAINEFQQAYELKPDPAYLFNIAQAYRQKGDPAKAVFFYKRYLALYPTAPNKADVEKRIAELEDIIKKQEDVKGKPPGNVIPGDGDKGGDTGDKGGDKGGDVAGGGGDGDVTGGSGIGKGGTGVTKTAERFRPIHMFATGGTAIIGLGDGPSVPAQLTVALGGSYTTVKMGKLGIDFGLSALFSPIPYSTSAGQSQTSSMFGIFATASGRYAVIPKLDLIAQIGLGGVFWSGIAEGNPFTAGEAEVEGGALGTFGLRGGLVVEYAVGGGLSVTATPFAFTYSPAPSGLLDSISSITRIDILVGLGYSL
jgi:hypothetical protein